MAVQMLLWLLLSSKGALLSKGAKSLTWAENSNFPSVTLNNLNIQIVWFGTFFQQWNQTPCWSVLDFWKINLEKSSSTNWIFSLFQTIFLQPVEPTKINLEIDFYRLKILFDELDFYNLIFFKSSTDQQGESQNTFWD